MVGNLVQAWGFMSGRYFVPPCLLMIKYGIFTSP